MPKDIQPEIRRLYGKLRAALTDHAPGDRFFSYQTLIGRFRTSRRALEQALARLEAEELIRIEPQVGIFVRKRPDPAVRRIVVVHSDWPSEYWQTLDAKFEEAFSTLSGCVFSRAFIPPGKEREFLFSRLNRELGDVALLTYAFSDCTQQDVARLLSCEIPLVFLENHISCDGVNAIDSEPEYTGMLAADCLLRNGHRKIAALVSESADLCVRRETGGFVAYLQLHGIRPQIINCRHHTGESSMITTEKAVYRHLRQHGALFTGCFVQGVFATNGLYQAVQSLGYSIPGDISVIANSEVPSAARCDPPLTTVARDFDGYVREVRAGVENLFSGKPFGIRRVPSLLIERASVKNLNPQQKGG